MVDFEIGCISNFKKARNSTIAGRTYYRKHRESKNKFLLFQATSVERHSLFKDRSDLLSTDGGHTSGISFVIDIMLLLLWGPGEEFLEIHGRWTERMLSLIPDLALLDFKTADAFADDR